MAAEQDDPWPICQAPLHNADHANMKLMLVGVALVVLAIVLVFFAVRTASGLLAVLALIPLLSGWALSEFGYGGMGK